MRVRSSIYLKIRFWAVWALKTEPAVSMVGLKSGSVDILFIGTNHAILFRSLPNFAKLVFRRLIVYETRHKDINYSLSYTKS